MTDIDYEALGKATRMALYGFTPTNWSDDEDRHIDRTARALVAALRDQGFVVVRADDLQNIMENYECFRNEDAERRLDAALAALGYEGSNAGL